MKLVTKPITISISDHDGSGRRLVLVDTSRLRGLSALEKTRNIYCLDSSDNIVWQIDPQLPPKSETDCFVSLTNIDGKVIADRFFGDEFEIDSMVGTAIHTGWHK